MRYSRELTLPRALDLNSISIDAGLGCTSRLLPGANWPNPQSFPAYGRSVCDSCVRSRKVAILGMKMS